MELPPDEPMSPVKEKRKEEKKERKKARNPNHKKSQMELSQQVVERKKRERLARKIEIEKDQEA
ncbi:MAG: hypothetical protein NWQ43_13240, partial [Dolichospermum sp.]|nr:hypothetical protein [Dolichospermum sp.]